MKKALSLIFAIVITVSLASCGKKEVKNPYNLDLCTEVEIVEEQSYFSDAVVSADGKTVDYICIVTLESTDEEAHNVKIYGDFKSESAAGHVAEETVWGTYAGEEKIAVTEAGLPLIKVIFTLTLPEDYEEGDTLKTDNELPDMYVVKG